MSDRLRRIEVAVGVAYGTDPDLVVEALRQAEAEQSGLVDEPAPQVIFTELRKPTSSEGASGEST
jgi:small-conductance mechanosensitive channel